VLLDQEERDFVLVQHALDLPTRTTIRCGRRSNGLTWSRRCTRRRDCGTRNGRLIALFPELLLLKVSWSIVRSQQSKASLQPGPRKG
jgi:hypothetical protein